MKPFVKVMKALSDPNRVKIIKMLQVGALGYILKSTDKIELIVMGGTWSCFPHQYKYWYIKRCFEACNHGLTGKKKKFKIF